MRKVKVQRFYQGDSQTLVMSSCEPRESDDSELIVLPIPLVLAMNPRKSLDILAFFTPSQINLHGQFHLGKGHPMLVARSAMYITY